jgi:hypothetical protein
MSAGAKIYAECLSHLGHGHPLYIPEPIVSANNEHGYDQVDGVAIGDVGIIRAEGDFDFLFDICDKPSRSLRARGVEANRTDSSGVIGNTDDIDEQRLIRPVQSMGSRNDMSDHIRSPSSVSAQVTSDAVLAGLEPIDAGEIRINTNFLSSENPCLAYGREDKVDAKLGAVVSFSEIT